MKLQNFCGEKLEALTPNSPFTDVDVIEVIAQQSRDFSVVIISEENTWDVKNAFFSR